MYWYQTKDDLGMFSKLGESKHEAIGMAGAGNMTWTKLEVDISDCHGWIYTCIMLSSLTSSADGYATQ